MSADYVPFTDMMSKRGSLLDEKLLKAPLALLEKVMAKHGTPAKAANLYRSKQRAEAKWIALSPAKAKNAEAQRKEAHYGYLADWFEVLVELEKVAELKKQISKQQ